MDKFDKDFYEWYRQTHQTHEYLDFNGWFDDLPKAAQFGLKDQFVMKRNEGDYNGLIGQLEELYNQKQ